MLSLPMQNLRVIQMRKLKVMELKMGKREKRGV
jgi:hypothetical protein